MTIAIAQNQNLQIDECRNIFRVARRVFTDPSIFDVEQRDIFEKCWLYVGHESEVSEAGQFHVRRVGGREVIFNRDMNGKVNAFLNACPHRGARLCTEKAGAAKSFYCYYHGWSFGADGALRILPDRGSFADDFNRDGSLNMIAVPKLHNYRGLYFVNFDPDAISLLDYLGDMARHIDYLLDQGAEMEVVPGAQEYAVQANWKLLSENSIDGNHAETLHATYFQYINAVAPPAGRTQSEDGKQDAGNVQGVCYELANGHVVLEYVAPFARAVAKWTPLWGEEVKAGVEANYQGLVGRFGAERADKIAHVSRNLLIFPNLAIVDSTGLTLRVGHPDGAHNTLVTSYALAVKGEDAPVRKARLFNFLEFLGPAGFATPDDIEAMEQCQKSYMMNAGAAIWNDMSKGSVAARQTSIREEGQVRGFWREWGRRTGESSVVPSAADQ